MPRFFANLINELVKALQIKNEKKARKVYGQILHFLDNGTYNDNLDLLIALHEVAVHFETAGMSEEAVVLRTRCSVILRRRISNEKSAVSEQVLRIQADDAE